MNSFKIMTLSLVLGFSSAHAADVVKGPSDLKPQEAALVSQLKAIQTKDSNCDKAYTNKLAKIEADATEGQTLFKTPADARETIKLLNQSKSPDAKTLATATQTMEKEAAHLRGEKILGQLFASVACPVFGQMEAVRRLVKNSKNTAKGSPSATEIKKVTLNYLSKPGMAIDEIGLLTKLTILRIAANEKILKVSPALLEKAHSLGTRAHDHKKTADAAQTPIWEKHKIVAAGQPDALSPEGANLLVKSMIARIPSTRGFMAEYEKILSEVKKSN